MEASQHPSLSPDQRNPCLSFIILLFLLLVFDAGNTFSQEIQVEDMIRQRTVSCKEIAFTTTALLQEYHQKQQHDTVQALLYYWESQCGMQEPMMRFLILHMIGTNTFYEDWYPQNLLVLLEDYHSSQKTQGLQNYYYDYINWEHYPLHPGFNAYTIALAEDLKRYEDITAVERYYLEFYSNNFKAAAEMKNSKVLAGSGLDSVHQQLEIEIRSRPRNYITLSGGFWKPTGKMATLGSHPELGISYEYQNKALLTNIYMDIAFVDAANNYQVRVDNQLYNTKVFIGVAFGLDMGLRLAEGKTTAFFLVPGIAYRGFESLNTDTENNWETPSNFIGSFSPNIGFYLRESTSAHVQLGIRARYNLVNFKNQGGTDLSGNVFNLGLVLGIGY